MKIPQENMLKHRLFDRTIITLWINQNYTGLRFDIENKKGKALNYESCIFSFIHERVTIFGSAFLNT